MDSRHPRAYRKPLTLATALLQRRVVTSAKCIQNQIEKGKTKMKACIFKGWICRQWIETEHGWTSDFDRFETEEEAREHGQIFVSLVHASELAREYEVYKDFELVF